MGIRKSNGHIRHVEFKATGTPKINLWRNKKSAKKEESTGDKNLN